MKKYFFLLIASLAISIGLFSQNRNKICENIFSTAVSLSDAGKYDIAIKKIAAYKLCCSPKENKKADSLLLQIYETVNKQKNEAIVARKSADSSAKVAIEQKNIAIKQKEANQTLLARNYWNNAQREGSENNLGLALLYTAEGILISKDKALTETMLLEIQPFLPKYFLKNIKEFYNHAPFAIFSPDGKLELTITGEDSIQLWNTTNGKKVGPVMEFGAEVPPFFSRDGKQLLNVSEGYIGILNTETGELVEKNDAATWDDNISLSPDGQWILTTSSGSAKICDMATGQQVGGDMGDSGAEMTSANFSPDGKLVLTSSKDSTALIWNAENGMQIGPGMKHKGQVLNAHFSPDGKRVLTACSDGTAHIWDAGNGLQTGPDMTHDDVVTMPCIVLMGKWFLLYVLIVLSAFGMQNPINKLAPI